MTPETASRQRWMGVLARAGNRLGDYEQQLMDAEFQLIRPAEIGMTMVRGRMGGTGAAFNLGEMTVTRCVVRFADGRTGYSYVAGRNKRHAELAALADAHLQGSDQQHWLKSMIEPLEKIQQAQRAAQQAEAASTRVEFVTMVRGES